MDSTLERGTAEAVIPVAIPGDLEGRQVFCRIPSLEALLVNDWLPLPLLQDVADAFEGLTGDEPQWVRPEDDEDERSWRASALDRWVIEALMLPRAVPTVDEAAIMPNAIAVGELSMALKRVIFLETYGAFMRQQQAVTQGGAAALTRFRHDVRPRVAA